VCPRGRTGGGSQVGWVWMAPSSCGLWAAGSGGSACAPLPGPGKAAPSCNAALVIALPMRPTDAETLPRPPSRDTGPLPVPVAQPVAWCLWPGACGVVPVAACGAGPREEGGSRGTGDGRRGPCRQRTRGWGRREQGGGDPRPLRIHLGRHLAHQVGPPPAAGPGPKCPVAGVAGSWVRACKGRPSCLNCALRSAGLRRLRCRAGSVSLWGSHGSARLPRQMCAPVRPWPWPFPGRLVDSRDIVELEMKHAKLRDPDPQEGGRGRRLLALRAPDLPRAACHGPHGLAHLRPGAAAPMPQAPAAAPPPACGRPTPPAPKAPAGSGLPAMLSPMAGTLYRSPAPGRASVCEGARGTGTGPAALGLPLWASKRGAGAAWGSAV